jgi:hypothetical protein
MREYILFRQNKTPNLKRFRASVHDTLSALSDQCGMESSQTLFLDHRVFSKRFLVIPCDFVVEHPPLQLSSTNGSASSASAPSARSLAVAALTMDRLCAREVGQHLAAAVRDAVTARYECGCVVWVCEGVGNFLCVYCFLFYFLCLVSFFACPVLCLAFVYFEIVRKCYLLPSLSLSLSLSLSVDLHLSRSQPLDERAGPAARHFGHARLRAETGGCSFARRAGVPCW